MAEKIALSVDIETGKAVSNLGQLEKATKKLNTTVSKTDTETQSLQQQFDSLNKEIKESPVNIRAMNKQIQAYQAIALNAGRTSPLGKQAIQQAAALKDKYIDIQNEVNRLANDGVKLQAALNIGTSVVAGFTAFQGVMAMSGVESEELRETMVKLQAAQSVLMGVETLRKNLEKESTIILVAKNTAEKANLALTKATTIATKALGLSTNATTKSFKLMRAAIIATGIGALVVGIALLIANWKKLSSWLSSTTAAQLAYNEAAEKAVEAVGEELSAIDSLQKTLKDETVTREDKNKAVAALQEKYPDLLGSINAEEMSLQKLNIVLKKAAELTFEKAKMDALAEMKVEEYKKVLQEKIDMQSGENVGIFENIAAWSSRLNPLQENIDATDLANHISRESINTMEEQTTVIDDLIDGTERNVIAIEGEISALTDLQIVRREQETEIQKAWDEQEDMRKKRAAKLKADEAASNKRAAERKRLRQQEEKALEVAAQKEIDRINRLKDTEAKALAKLILDKENMENAYLDSKVAKDQQEINAVTDKYFTLLTLAEENGLNTDLLLEAQEAEKAAIKNRFIEEAKLKKEADDQKEIDDSKAIRDAKIADIQATFDVAMQGANAIQSLGDAVFAHKMKNIKKGSKEEEAMQKKQFKFNKALQLGMAVIDGAKAITASLAAAPVAIGVIPNPAGIASLAFAAATSAANIATIASKKFEGGGGGGADAPAAPTPDIGGAPALKPITNTSTLVPQGNKTDNKVYVTETDISATQNQVNVIEAQATI